METLVTHDPAKIAKAKEEGRVNENDMETVVSNALQDIINQLFPTSSIEVKMNNAIYTEFLKVEKNCDNIPWLDTRGSKFFEISPLIASVPDVLYKEAAKLVAEGFPKDQVIPLFSSCIKADKEETERLRLLGQTYKREVPFLVPYVSEEVDCGKIRVTTTDRTQQPIHSLATDIPVNRSMRVKHAHIKSTLILLVKHSLDTTKIPQLVEFDYEIVNTLRLNLFICIS